MSQNWDWRLRYGVGRDLASPPASLRLCDQHCTVGGTHLLKKQPKKGLDGLVHLPGLLWVHYVALILSLPRILLLGPSFRSPPKVSSSRSLFLFPSSPSVTAAKHPGSPEGRFQFKFLTTSVFLALAWVIKTTAWKSIKSSMSRIILCDNYIWGNFNLIPHCK